MDGEYEEVVITYQELDRRARSIGAFLQQFTKAGDRALLLFPPGLDFIAAYFGCLYARIIAVPAYPPHNARLEKSIRLTRHIVDDARPALALISSSLFSAINSADSVKDIFADTRLVAIDSIETNDWCEKWREQKIGTNEIAFLQYTSGSTTTPRGVIVTHGNLLHNLELIERSFGQSSQSHAVIWLPPYHDMGLVGGILQPLFSGYPVTLMPHLMFLQRPYRWLEAISRFQSTTSGGPNFAYDLCVRKIKPEQRASLDLSCWEVAFNGAEPVYYKSLDQFADYFGPCGFRREAFLPCYGLAESTLLVSGGPKSKLPEIKCLENSPLEQNQVSFCDESTTNKRVLVGCGHYQPDQHIKIVDPVTLKPSPANEVGEIWLRGPSVASGYWNKSSDTKLTFNAHLSGTGEGPFLRTGDLGFVHDGELFITGRMKSLIISEGKNHYPHDIERTVEESNEAIKPGSCAVFSVNNFSAEQVIVIVELAHNDKLNHDKIRKDIRNSISACHDLKVNDIRIIAPGKIPRTTSGKIKHHLCKENYVDGLFNETILI